MRDERALQDSVGSLNQSEAKLRGLFHQSSNFIGLMTTDGVLIEANQTALVASGIEAEDALYKPFAETPWWAHSPVLNNVYNRPSIWPTPESPIDLKPPISRPMAQRSTSITR